MPAQSIAVPTAASAVDRMSLQASDARLGSMPGPTSMYDAASMCFAEPDGYNALHGWSFDAE